jgi:hypothetical protein
LPTIDTSDILSAGTCTIDQAAAGVSDGTPNYFIEIENLSTNTASSATPTLS